MKPVLAFSKLSPKLLSFVLVIFTEGSRTIFALPSKESKKRHPASSRYLLILIRARASFDIVLF